MLLPEQGTPLRPTPNAQPHPKRRSEPTSACLRSTWWR